MLSFLSTNSAIGVASIVRLLVGAIFLWSGGIKATSPHVFELHVRKLSVIPRQLVRASVVVAAALEVGWGLGLILGVAPALLLPATALLLVGLTAVTWFGVRSGRTTDCGCYGGYVVPSLAQSFAMNATLIALTIAAWLIEPQGVGTSAWKLVAVAAVSLGVGGLTAASLQFAQKHGRFMLDMSPLKVGRAWRSRWGSPLPEDGEYLVSYLGPDCPHCKQWVRVLNAMSQSSGLPDVVGIVAATDEKLGDFVETSGIRFPMRTVAQTQMSRLAWAVPTTVLVSDGKIQDRWTGRMPAEFYQRFRDAFFPKEGASVAPATAPVASRST